MIAQLQVLLDCEVRENASSFRNVRHTGSHDVLRGHAVQRAAEQLDRAIPSDSSANRSERGCLAGAVGAEQRDDLAFCDAKRDSVQDLGRSITGAHICQLEHLHYESPRYASITAGFPCTSAGVPSAIFRPKSRTTTRSEIPMTKPMLCSTRRTVMPSSEWMRRTRRAISATSSWLMPPAGSSSITSRGFE